MLPDFRLKGEGGVAQAKDTIESCMAACRPRTNLAHGKSLLEHILANWKGAVDHME